MSKQLFSLVVRVGSVMYEEIADVTVIPSVFNAMFTFALNRVQILTTVEPPLMGTSLTRTPLHYGQFQRTLIFIFYQLHVKYY